MNFGLYVLDNSYEVVVNNSHGPDPNKPKFSHFHYLNCPSVDLHQAVVLWQ